MTISYEEQRARFAEVVLAYELTTGIMRTYKDLAAYCWQIADVMMSAATEPETSKPTVLNVNSTVRVTLTDHGRAVYENFWASASKGGPYFPPKEDANGQIEWKLWQLMQVFGPHMSLGGRPCFEADIEVVE
jgi:hypothetical protein